MTLLETHSLPEAARFTEAASALAVTGYGSRSSYPTRRQIEVLLPDLTVKFF